MQKLINAPAAFVDDFLDGVLLSHPDTLKRGSDERTVISTNIPPEVVPIVTGGGSGHLPLFLGYVGEGLVGGAAVGGVFNSPGADQILAAIQAVDTGNGVLLLYGNYGGDVMNFDLAAELAEQEGIRTRTVRATDDVVSATRDRKARRRGVAGLALLYKIAGAASRAKFSLDDLACVVEGAAEGLATAGVGLSPCILPSVGHATFELPEGSMEIGIGLHGEPGVRRVPLDTAKSVANQLLDLVLDDLALAAGDRVALMVNGLGATPSEELYILAAACHHRLRSDGLTVARSYVGEFATSLEMAGASVSILRVGAELEQLLGAPATAAVLDRW
jgi:dihydroxyacetone kinase/dihydroxyacetone kinase-like protein